MALFTPPSTAHRTCKDKENRQIDPSSRVIFAKDDKIHILASPTITTTSISQKLLLVPKLAPGRSILKKRHSIFLTPFDEGEPQREATPEPSDPLCDLAYLAFPVSVITRPAENGVVKAASLKDVIEAYSVLAARLRTCVTGSTDVDASWPLFQPLRKNRDAFVWAVVRDLGKAMVDPAVETKEEERERDQRVLLPSPKNTPKKKRDGMTAEQVKRARDLCTTSHAVIKMLSLLFTLPALYTIFSDSELRSMLTAVLAIPLADNLPTLNARKTCALAIWLIQTQRLPPAVLAPAADRIAFALARGIDGELGKEGKKGSASDGLKAVHDLSIHAPSIFIPAFTNVLLPSVLSNLLAPTLPLRTLACHALGGFVLGTLEVPRSAGVHARISDIVTGYFLHVPPQKPVLLSPTKLSPTKPHPAVGPSPSSPTKPANPDPAIIRTLRTTLQATDPAHPTHGPVWALLVLAALMVLMNERVVREGRVGRAVSGLVNLAMRHRRAAVRGLACLVWRAVAWVWCQPRLVVEEEEREERERTKERKAREQWWELVVSVPDLEMGTCTVAALLGGVEGCEEWVGHERECGGEGGVLMVRRVLEVMRVMTERDGKTAMQALDVLKQLVGAGGSVSSPRRCDGDEEQEGNTRKPSLLPRSLFSALPGLLSADWRALGAAVNPIFDETPKAEDVRCLTREELAEGWTGLVGVWRGVLGCAGVWEHGVQPRRKGKSRQEEDGDGEVCAGLVGVWEGLVGARVAALQDEGDEDATCEFAMSAVGVIVDSILQDETLDLTPKNRELPRFSMASPSPPTPSSGSALKLKLAKALWGVLRDVFPQPAILAKAGETLLASLMKNAGDYTDFGGVEGDVEVQTGDIGGVNARWTEFCVDVLAVCGCDAVRAFWGYPDVESGERLWDWGWCVEERGAVWRVFCGRWMEEVEGEWEGGVVLLGVPFLYDTAWELSKPDDEIWHRLLDYSVNKALDYGHDSATVLACLAGTVSGANHAAPTAASSCVQLVEFLMSHVASAHDDGDDMREIPESVLELVNETMGAAYPPASREKTRYLWAARAVMEVVEKCPATATAVRGMVVVGDVIRGVMEGVAVWVEDETEVWSLGELEYDIVPLYQIILVRIQELPVSVDTLRTFAPFIGCPFGAREAVREMCVEPFREFWEAGYAQLEAPEDGWPEEIQTSLGAVFGPSASKREEVPQGTTPTPCGTKTATATTTTTLRAPGSGFKLVPASWTSDMCPDSEPPAAGWRMTRPSTPTTPTTGSRATFASSAHASAVTPPRPHKPPVSFLTQLQFGSSPGTPVRVPGSVSSHPQTPRKTPCGRTPRSEEASPSKRRKLEEDKENERPVMWALSPGQGRIQSVAERIAEVCGGGGGSGRTLGKRRSFNGGEEEGGERPSPLKKGRKVMEVVEDDDDDDDDVTDVEAEDVFGTKATPATFATLYAGPSLKPINIPLHPALAPVEDRQEKHPQPPSKKRKRVFMDAVEIPSLKEVYGYSKGRSALRVSASFDSGLKTRTSRPVSAAGGVARRTRSATKMRGSDAASASCVGYRERDAGAKRRRASVSRDRFGPASDDVDVDVEAPSSDPIEARPRSAGVGGRRVAFRPPSSSDDDPHLGQVTPHRLISPDLKKSARFFEGGEVGSDDSVPSPSKEIVERKMKRIGSFTVQGGVKGKPLKALVF